MEEAPYSINGKSLCVRAEINFGREFISPSHPSQRLSAWHAAAAKEVICLSAVNDINIQKKLKKASFIYGTLLHFCGNL